MSEPAEDWVQQRGPLCGFLKRVAQRASRFRDVEEAYFTRRTLGPKEACLAVAKHWNSETPVIPRMVRPTDRYRRLQAYSLGGGYFLAAHNCGLAIDPGYNFTQMLFSEYGFTICDIDAVIVTHDHPDHWGDLANLVLLKHIARSRYQGRTKSRPLRVYLDVSSHKAHEGLFSSGDDVRLIRPEEPRFRIEGEGASKGSWVHCLRTFHNERFRTPGTWGKGVGLAIEVDRPEENGRAKTIVITSDTQYPRLTKLGKHSGLPEFTQHDVDAWQGQVAHYAEGNRTDVLCLHIGSVEACVGNDNFRPEHFASVRDFCENVCYEGHHLGFAGCLKLIDDFYRRHERRGVVVVSEFGEELRGARAELARWLQALAKANRSVQHDPVAPVLPGDLGLLLDLRTEEVGVLCGKCRGNRVCARKRCPMEDRGCGFPLSQEGRKIDLAMWFGRTNYDLFHPARKVRYFEDVMGELIHYYCEMGSSAAQLECGACQTDKVSPSTI